MISLLVVNYRSAALTAEAIRTARAASSEPLQAIVVDNSCDSAEAEVLRRGVADTLVVSETNRGYAGGVNLGRRACDGDVIVVSNPDVRFAPEALDLLVAELRGRTAVAGPALYWDDAHEWLLPPGDLGTAKQKLDEILASRSHAWFTARDRRRVRARIAFWSLQRPTRVRMLSGAVLAIRAQDFDAIGGFDERFPLYFEEADFLRRLSEHRRQIVYVPAAKCRHLYNQSAAQVAESAAARYAQSELRYLEKWNGPLAARVLKRLERPMRTDGAEEGILHLERDGLVVEASPLASFTTAAGHFPRSSAVSSPVSLPREILASTGRPLWLRTVVRATGEVLATVRISA